MNMIKPGQFAGVGATACYAWAPSCRVGYGRPSSLPSVSHLSPSAQASIVTIYAAYLVNSLYSGPVFNLRRGSDNVMADFYVDSLGNLGMEAGATGTSVFVWLGFGSATAYVTVWYDQSGQANHATQSNRQSQPVYNVGGQYVDFTGSLYMNTNTPVSLVGKRGNSIYTAVVKHGVVNSWAGSGSLFSIGNKNDRGNEQMSIHMNGGQYSDQLCPVYGCWGGFGRYAPNNVVALTYRQDVRRGYVNDVPVEEGWYTNRSIGTSPGHLGVFDVADSNTFLNGQMYSLILSDKALDSNITTLSGCVLCPAGTYLLSSTLTCNLCPTGNGT